MLSNVLPLFGVLLWPFLVMVSPMFFDAPGSENNPLNWAFYYVVLAYPFPTITGAIMSYHNWKRDADGRRCLASTLLTYSGIMAILLIAAIETAMRGISS
ncbi:MAG TPA: hypothetical protein VN371_03400 [Chlorobaculum sp.]|nr:hypothetical protein [Chlorobaculum sp.]